MTKTKLYTHCFSTVCFTLFLIILTITFQQRIYATRCIRNDYATSEAYKKCLSNEAQDRRTPAPQTNSKETQGNTPKPRDKSSKTIWSIINSLIKALSAAVVLAILISTVVAGIQYSTSDGNASAVAAAKKRIGISILCLILFIFGFALLQYLIPAGI